MKKLLLLLTVLSQSIFLSAQDFTFIDYSNLPTVLNPAFTGDGCGPRVSIFGQSITSSSIVQPTYRTLGINFDMPFELINDFTLGLGYRYYNELAGTILGLSGHAFAASIHKKLVTSKLKHTISFAVEGGVNNRTLNDDDLRWPNQIDSTGFNPNLPSGEPDFTTDYIYGDVNVGLAWKTDLSNKTSITLGSSIYHINQPTISFLNSDTQIAIRTQFHAMVQTKVSDKIGISPFVYYTKQGTHDTYNFGLWGNYELSKKAKIMAGLGYIKNGQPYLTAMLMLKKLSIGGNVGLKNDAGHTRYEAVVGYRFKDCD